MCVCKALQSRTSLDCKEQRWMQSERGDCRPWSSSSQHWVAGSWVCILDMAERGWHSREEDGRPTTRRTGCLAAGTVGEGFDGASWTWKFQKVVQARRMAPSIAVAIATSARGVWPSTADSEEISPRHTLRFISPTAPVGASCSSCGLHQWASPSLVVLSPYPVSSSLPLRHNSLWSSEVHNSTIPPFHLLLQNSSRL